MEKIFGKRVYTLCALFPETLLDPTGKPATDLRSKIDSYVCEKTFMGTIANGGALARYKLETRIRFPWLLWHGRLRPLPPITR